MKIKECKGWKKEAAQTNKLSSALQTQPDHHWSLYDLLMVSQCANATQWTQNELKMSKIHQGVSNYLKVSLEPFHFGNISLRWIITTCHKNQYVHLFYDQITQELFWRAVLDLCRRFEFVHHQISGFWIWLLPLILKWFTVKNQILWLYQCKFV